MFQARSWAICLTWNDEVWIESIRRFLSAEGRDSLDQAISTEMTAVSRGHARQFTPDWTAAEAEARQRIEARFNQRGRGSRP